MTVTEVLEASELSHLAPYTVPGADPPPDGASLLIWDYLAAEWLPELTDRALRHTPPETRAFCCFRLLSQALKLSDRSLSDAKRPTADAWARQLTLLNAFLEYRRTFKEENSQFLVQKEELNVRRARVKELAETLDREWMQLDASSVRAEYESRESEIRDLAEAEADLQAHKAELENRLVSANEKLEQIEQTLALARDNVQQAFTHIDLLKQVASEGIEHLERQRTGLKETLAVLEETRRRQEQLLEQYSYTSRVLDRLVPTLQELANAASEFFDTKDARLQTELLKVRPLKLKAAQLNQQIQSATSEIERSKARLEQLRVALAELNQQLDSEELEGSSDPGVSIDGSVEIEKAETDLAALKKEEEHLNLVLKTQRKWLRAMDDVEKRGNELLDENGRIRNWMVEFLRSEAK